MEILLALIFGGAVGAGAHYLLPGRELRGVVLASMLGAVAAGLAWSMMTWLGMGLSHPLLWVISAAAPFVVVPLALRILTARRTAYDAQTRAALKI